MATLEDVKLTVRTQAGILDPSAWQSSNPVPLPYRPTVSAIRYSTTVVNEENKGVSTVRLLYVNHLGEETEAAWYETAPSVDEAHAIEFRLQADAYIREKQNSGAYPGAHAVRWHSCGYACDVEYTGTDGKSVLKMLYFSPTYELLEMDVVK